MLATQGVEEETDAECVNISHPTRTHSSETTIATETSKRRDTRKTHWHIGGQ
jgi:hypothetical protein